MKTKTLLISLMIVITIMLGACSQRSEPSETMPEKEMSSDANSTSIEKIVVE